MDRLKLGILLDSYQVPAWAYSSLERIVRSDYAEFSLIVLNDGPSLDQSDRGKFWKSKNEIVYRIFSRIDEKLFHGDPDAFELRNLLEIMPDVPAIRIRPIQGRDSDCLRPSDIDRIKEYELDILVKLGFSTLRGGILTASRYGVWAYCHSDGRTHRGDPPGFWEVVENWPETGSVLYILDEGLSTGKVLYRSWFSTYPFSPARNRHHCFWASASFLPRQVERLHRVGEKRFFDEIARFNPEFDLYDHRQYKTPSNVLALRLVTRLFVKIIFEVCQRAFGMVTWYLMFDLNENAPVSFGNFREIFPPRDRFWADPNVIHDGSSYYVFVEEYVYKAKKGHISVIEMDQQGNHRDPVRVLEKGYHLSYPFVFEWEGKHFMVPESAENKTIDLYECVEFPYRWKFKMSLMENVRAVDTTLFCYSGKWWLFTGMAENEGAFPQVELFLFFSDTLLTREWTPHPLNPIVSDVKRARPAGRLFTRNGKIFRPSQDCSKIYGFGFDLNEILLLSETEYHERAAASVRPYWDKKVQATHTFATEGRLTIIDAFTRRQKLF